MHRIIFTCVCLVLFSSLGADGLKITEIQVAVRADQGESEMTLTCIYDLEHAPLYSVKWYQNQYEFYRYNPNERPASRIFHIPGVYVDLTRSNESQVLLTGVKPGPGVNFTCEVMTEAPTFFTSQTTTHVVISDKPPKKL